MSDKCDACGKPRPCPFCGSEIGPSGRRIRAGIRAVQCDECGAEGPLSKTEAEALAHWNAAGQDTRRLNWYLHRSRVRGWDHDRTSIETGSDYLSGMRKWIDECLG
jgi:Lar family restriction alleviation protein